ncbi:DNA repair protein RecN [Paeniglutamicibacter antarcticus]|uniref:DNA repair protein RecN n=1 Tax=Arthrobacter terrae TaxID=2935737 RepID=A0A931GBB8_9MICC|nr:DNA repair protein RecN [Arthrobacter terrae]MBG0740577.1 DNA repair protein RecN [Arthrobacter terrae]
MIEEIRIRDLGVIAEATLPLGPGLSVVSGETGAGKTMVVTAVGLLLGARSDAGAVRTGAKSASAEASVRLPLGHRALARALEAGADIDEFDAGGTGSGGESGTSGQGGSGGSDSDAGKAFAGLVLARTVGADGRSRAHVGGRLAPVGVLTELGEQLVAVHGQSDQIRLKSNAAQRDALDRFAGDFQKTFAAGLEQYRTLFRRWQHAQTELEELRHNGRERLREAEALRLALAEIDEVDPQAGEDDVLKAESIKLANLEELRLASQQAREALITDDFGAGADATTLVDTAKRLLEGVADHDEELGSAAARLTEAGIILADIARDLAGYSTSLDSDGPGRLAEVEDRRGALAVLVRKYAPSVDGVLTWAEESRVRLDELQDDSGRIEALETEVAAAAVELAALSARLTASRTKAAAELSRRVSAELTALAMPDAKLVIDISAASAPGINGADEIVFLLQPHTGAAPRPLGKGASGGELSRVMLAIEVVLAAVDPVPTFVFDEVDAGVGGKAAVEIGRRLAMLAKHVQVLVVTHLPQVAAFADQHIRVIKTSGGGFTSSDVTLLDDAGRVRELARMLAGQEDSATAQAHARELLDEARSGR